MKAPDSHEEFKIILSVSFKGEIASEERDDLSGNVNLEASDYQEPVENDIPAIPDNIESCHDTDLSNSDSAG
ncbi:hypothetical protein CRI94_02030 [Longibacter salinarum]|uniref:Uncharacterized protein n=1 Tax=Longibacter salinarum TaxID=1850348 RepID=A0A2A8D2H4_9BACT|nr:hypothetical protein CRI94_02030 [Longibacter salinarum]